MKIIYIILILAKALDFISTIILGSNAEENTLVRNMWEYFGVIGFLIFNIKSIKIF